jgi:ferritin-like metal-binding protein YciE
MRSPTDTINSYITDMLALEEHIEKAVTGQIQALGDHPQVGADLQTIQRWVHLHISNLKQLTATRGAATATDAIKRAGSSVLGRAAGAIDLLRHEGQPKNLRDDYTAFSLAAIGYVMLNTTALALGDKEVADLANQHLGNYARGVIALHYIIPAVVVRSLQKEGLPAREDVLTDVYRNVEEAWRLGKTVHTHTARETTVPGRPSY